MSIFFARSLGLCLDFGFLRLDCGVLGVGGWFAFRQIGVLFF